MSVSQYTDLSLSAVSTLQTIYVQWAEVNLECIWNLFQHQTCKQIEWKAQSFTCATFS